MGYDFILETKLIKEAPELHGIFSDNVLCVQNMLNKYKSVFPSYTDHTALHSLEVIAFCNELVGDNIGKMNTDEIFILLMAAYLHDSGMGISQKDYEEFSEENQEIKKFIGDNPGIHMDEVIREYHHEFSGMFIRKYADLFDFPSEQHLFAVVQTSRGHRKLDLYDKGEYPDELKTPNGNRIHLPYLATLIRLADELDIAADRNIQFLYNLSSSDLAPSIYEFKKHKAIKQICFTPEMLDVYVDYSDRDLAPRLDRLFEKLNGTLTYCVNVVESRTPFTVEQKKIRVRKLV